MRMCVFKVSIFHVKGNGEKRRRKERRVRGEKENEGKNDMEDEKIEEAKSGKVSKQSFSCILEFYGSL